MVPFSCSLALSQTSVSKFISDQPFLSTIREHCTTMKDLHSIHAQLIKTGLAKDPIAASQVLAFCTSRSGGDINYAYLLFTQIENPNLFIWNTIIRGFSQSSTPQNAISLFIEMLVSSPIQPQRLTYPSVFKAYAQLGLAHDGAQLHGRVVKLGLQCDQYIRNTILYMYANCGLSSEARRMFYADKDFDIVTWNSMIMGLAKSGEVDESRKLFDKMPTRNTITWNSMISGYVRNGRFMDAMDLFYRMQEERIKPSEFTMVSLLNACGRLGAIRQGEWIHDYLKNHFVMNVIVVTAIIDMYCKCGGINEALQVFEGAPKKGISSWNSMILGLAMNGYGDEAILLFTKLESTNLKPDYVSFIGVLTACNHSGKVDLAKDYFLLMIEKYGIMPSVKHYSCMVDVLGGAGLLEEAKEVIKSMPSKPDSIIWGSLLSACRKHGNLEMAKLAAKHVIEFDPCESSGYVLMSNIYAASGQFEEAIKQRHYLKEKQMEKEPGCSLIEVDGEVQEFIAGGRLNCEAQEIYHLLNDV
ncbi:pentatricopeptide repeat-containing protein [Tripterygium wilfordii]|uniref:Pentatricopeptide repeat-containing protein n=1 Tax=Tripterygium wilfordii TaxID=458696 RepID=A0A7J7DCG6_TRIWF|nr:pentatricopeptide repeat-containing protein At2g42920, chloroplastic [Tripterygium wilfordii]KAF5744037.1 pentatricopeptide repeat-containing protein [Tripterygium wilfordii]